MTLSVPAANSSQSSDGVVLPLEFLPVLLLFVKPDASLLGLSTGSSRKADMLARDRGLSNAPARSPSSENLYKNKSFFLKDFF